MAREPKKPGAKKQDPKKAEEHTLRGHEHFDSGNYQQAIMSYSKALAEGSKDLDTVFNLGMSLQQEGMHSVAEKSFSGLSKRLPEDPEVHFRLALSRVAQGKLAQARESYLKTLEHTSDPEMLAAARHNLGDIEKRLGNLEAAKTHFERALGHNSALSKTKSALEGVAARIAEEAKKAPAPKTETMQARPKTTDKPPARPKTTDKPPTRPKTAETSPRPKTAEQPPARPKTAEKPPADIEFRGPPPMVRKEVIGPEDEESARKQGRLAPKSIIDAARKKIAAYDYEGARSVLKKNVGKYSNDPQIHYLLGFANSRLGRHERARIRFERAVTLDPENAQYHNGLGRALHDIAKGHLEMSAELYGKRIPEDVATGKRVPATGEIRDYAKADSSLWDARIHLGLARQSYEKALSLNPSMNSARSNMAKLTQSMVEHNLLSLTHPGTDFDPQRSFSVGRHPTYNSLMKNLEASGDLALKARTLGRLKQRYPMNTQISYDLGNAFLEFADRNKADPDTHSKIKSLALLHYLDSLALSDHMSDTDIIAQRQLKNISSELSKTFSKDIAQGYAEEADTVDTAQREHEGYNDQALQKKIDLMVNAVHHDPLNPSYHHALGVAQGLVGMNREAMISLRRAQHLNPDDPNITRAIAEHYEKMGDKKAARDSYAALLRGPSKNNKKLLEKIDSLTTEINSPKQVKINLLPKRAPKPKGLKRIWGRRKK